MIGRTEWGRGPFAVSAERRALRAAIVEQPNERALYETYARSAIAEGDPRGEYVRLALLRDGAEAAALPAIDDARATLRARYGRSIYAEWFPEPFAARLGWIAREPDRHERLGFVTRVPARAEDVPALRALAPLAEIELRREHAPPAAVPAGGDLHALPARGPIAVPQIAKRFPGTRELSFHNTVLGEADVETLAALPALESLKLIDRCPGALLSALARSDAFPRLSELELWECNVDLARVGAVASTRSLTKLVVEPGGQGGLAALLDALDGAAVESLVLFGYGPDLYAPLDLSPFRTARLPRLRSLWLGEHRLEHLEALAGSPVFAQLTTLTLTGIDGVEEALRTLGPAIRRSSIRTLRESDGLGRIPHAALADGRAFERLESLRTSGPLEDGAGLRALLDTMPGLTRLEIDADLTPELLERALRIPALRELHPRFAIAEPARVLPPLLAGKLEGLPLRSVNVPDLSAVDAATLHRLIDAPGLVEVGSLGIAAHRNELSRELLTLLQRRFGHRLIPALHARRSYASDLSYGVLPEPDLDPWWRGG